MAEELKITTLDEVKTVLERLLSLMEAEEPKVDEEEAEEKEPGEESSEGEKEDAEKSVLAKVDEAEQSTVNVLKYDDEKRLVYAVAYPLMPKGKSDIQSDRIEADELEKASHNWLMKSRKYDLHHRELNVSNDAAVVVESYIAPVDINYPLPSGQTKLITKGSWVVVTHFPDIEMWRKIRSGEFGAYSIRGKAIRKKVVR